MKSWEMIINSLQTDKIKLLNENERLKIQVETCESMLRKYNSRIEENEKNINTINNIQKGFF